MCVMGPGLVENAGVAWGWGWASWVMRVCVECMSCPRHGLALWEVSGFA